MPFVVTGISQDGNTAALEAALTAAGLPLEVFEVLGPEDAESQVEGSGLVDTGIITGGGLETGTGVPGLSGSGVPGISGPERVAGLGDLGGNSLWDRLADLAIPDDEVENYAAVLEAGRSIVAYHGDAASIAKVEGLFAGAGLAKIKTF